MVADPELRRAYAEDTLRACAQVRSLMLECLRAPAGLPRQALEIALHGVKGAASALAVADADRLCHALESLLRLGPEAVPFDALLPALLQGTAELEAQAWALRVGEAPAATSELTKSLLNCALGLAAFPPGEARWPAALLVQEDEDELEALFAAHRKAPPVAPSPSGERLDALGPYAAAQVKQLGEALHKAVEFDYELPALILAPERLGQLRTQLGHLLRNALDHGLETPPERQAAGKKAVGHLRLRGQADENHLTLELEDDGAGIDFARLRQRWPMEDGPPEALLDLLCAPGVSARDSASLVSGRGLGLASVREALRTLGGSLAVRSTAKQGTIFTLTVPLAKAEV